jgi:hypothetical protein
LRAKKGRDEIANCRWINARSKLSSINKRKTQKKRQQLRRSERKRKMQQQKNEKRKSEKISKYRPEWRKQSSWNMRITRKMQK